MEQVTLHRYFNSTHKPQPPTSRLSFLDLPYHVRERVYILAGLVRECSIDLNSDPAFRDEDRIGNLTRPKRVDDSDAGAFKCFTRNRMTPDKMRRIMPVVDCPCEPLPYRLLYVSRVISAEVLSILYSRNKFRVCRTRPGGLRPLQRLGSKALASMRSLCVGLSACPCHKNSDAYVVTMNVLKRCICDLESRQDGPLGRVSAYDRSVISEWSRLCGYIGAHIAQSQMRLTLLCDTVDYETAEEVVKPLLGLPTLKDCSIRLGRRPCHKLRRLAELTIARVTGRATDHLESVFRFTDLPEEIQEHILGFTDLVAPQDVQWESLHGLASSIYCDSCSEVSEACCCPVTHAAFTTACGCWRMPYEKFQVSHKMREDAIRIFYSKNHFVVHTLDCPDLDDALNPLHAAPPRFLPPFPLHGFRYLRSLQWVFPRFYGTRLCHGENLLQDWLDTIDCMVRRVDVSKLILTIDMTSDLPILLFASANGLVNTTSEASMWSLYQQIIEPMIAFKGLQDLFVHLAWPLDHHKHDLRVHQERVLERRVMGEHYDSSARGKVSAWGREHGWW